MRAKLATLLGLGYVLYSGWPANAGSPGRLVAYAGPRTRWQPVPAHACQTESIFLVLYRVKDVAAYDLIVPPGLDPERLKVIVPGSELVEVTDRTVVWKLGRYYVVHRDPIAYQKTPEGTVRRLEAAFLRQGEGVGFRVPGRDPDLPLLIDPEILNLSYSGNTDREMARAVAVGPDGSLFLGGSTDDGAQEDVLVVKIAAGATNVEYVTIISGSGDETATGIAVDPAGRAYVCGYTDSSDFPVVNAIQSTLAGARDAFLCVLDAAGTNLLFSTYLGGRLDDFAQDLCLRTDGVVAVAGYTLSDDFPIQAAYQTNLLGDRDAFVTAFAPDLSSHVFSSYLGGDSREYGYGVAADSMGNFVICGYTYSSNFPTSTNAFQTDLAGAADIFVAALASYSLQYASLLGGSGTDMGRDVSVSGEDLVAIVGRTDSPDLPLEDAFQTNLAGDTDAVVVWLAPAATSLVFASYLGGSVLDVGTSVAVDRSNRLYCCGYTLSTNLPVELPVQALPAGTYDAFAAGILPGEGELLYCSYLGGSLTDRCYAAAMGTNLGLVIAGFTDSPDLPVTNAAQSAYGGGGDIFYAWLPHYPLPFGVGEVALSNGWLRVNWPGARGWSFTVEAAQEISGPWSAYSTNENLTGVDATMTVGVDLAPARRYVRITAR